MDISSSLVYNRRGSGRGLEYNEPGCATLAHLLKRQLPSEGDKPVHCHRGSLVRDFQMHPEDRVLVAVMNRPQDFEIARDQGWYRVPERTASRGVHFEYVAFYFTGAFGDQAWAVHHYARRLGHELATRRELLPDEADHPRAGEHYYKLQLGPLQRRDPPIVSLRWRRVTFIHTTWDRFEAAGEINDLFAEGGEFVDRLYHALRDANLAPERRYPVRESGVDYVVNLAVPCRQGIVVVDVADAAPSSTTPGALRFGFERLGADPHGCLEAVRGEVERRGGPSPLPQEADVPQQAGEDRHK